MTDPGKSRLVLLSLGAFLLSVSGCSSRPERGEVDGLLTWKGKPLANVLVAFVPDADHGVRASGVTDSQGRFRLQSADQLDGAVVGDYRVILEDLDLLKAERSPDGTVLRSPPVRFPASYSDLLKTPLRQKVGPGSQTVELTLKDLP